MTVKNGDETRENGENRRDDAGNKKVGAADPLRPASERKTNVGMRSLVWLSGA